MSDFDDEHDGTDDDRLACEDEQKRKERTEKNHMLWVVAAQMIGFNVLARDEAKTLGAKIYFRMARDMAQARFVELGGRADVMKDNPSPVVATLTFPEVANVILREKDIELMRAAVQEYDAKKKM